MSNPTIFVDLQYVPEPAARKLLPGRSRWQPWRITVKSADNRRVLFRSSERYTNLAAARRAADIAFGPNSDVYLRQPEQGDVALRLAQ